MKRRKKKRKRKKNNLKFSSFFGDKNDRKRLSKRSMATTSQLSPVYLRLKTGNARAGKTNLE